MALLPRKRIDVAAGAAGQLPTSASDGLGRGMEIALSLLLFVGLGWLADSAAGTKPLFVVVFVVFCLVGQFVKLKADYDVRMRRLEAERAELRRAHPPRARR